MDLWRIERYGDASRHHWWLLGLRESEAEARHAFKWFARALKVGESLRLVAPDGALVMLEELGSMSPEKWTAMRKGR